MPRNTDKPLRELKLFTRPPQIIEAEQKRHDRARVRGLIAFFCALFLGGGVAVFVVQGPWFGNAPNLQILLVGLVFIAPLAAAFVMLARVPPPPFESLGDAHRDIDKKQAQWRASLMSQIFVFGLLGAESFWLWPRPMRQHNQHFWLFFLPALVPMLCMVFLVIMSLYVRPGWLNPDFRLDDEVTRSFRARAQRLGYLLLLFIFVGVYVLARISAETAVRFMPLGLALGGALPMLYFVYLDWQASRSG